jgi:hypothetical protein
LGQGQFFTVLAHPPLATSLAPRLHKRDEQGRSLVHNYMEVEVCRSGDDEKQGSREELNAYV